MTSNFLNSLLESRAFGDYLDANEKQWLDYERNQEMRKLPGLRDPGGYSVTPKPSITADDFGGQVEVAKLRNSRNPEAQLDRLISSAESDRDYDRAARLTGFRNEFRLQRDEMEQGYRRQWDSATASDARMAPPESAQAKAFRTTPEPQYHTPLQTREVQKSNADKDANRSPQQQGSFTSSTSPSSNSGSPSTGPGLEKAFIAARKDAKNYIKRDEGSPDQFSRQLNQVLNDIEKLQNDPNISKEDKERQNKVLDDQLRTILQKADKQKGGDPNAKSTGSSNSFSQSKPTSQVPKPGTTAGTTLTPMVDPWGAGEEPSVTRQKIDARAAEDEKNNAARAQERKAERDATERKPFERTLTDREREQKANAARTAPRGRGQTPASAKANELGLVHSGGGLYYDPETGVEWRSNGQELTKTGDTRRLPTNNKPPTQEPSSQQSNQAGSNVPLELSKDSPFYDEASKAAYRVAKNPAKAKEYIDVIEVVNTLGKINRGDEYDESVAASKSVDGRTLGDLVISQLPNREKEIRKLAKYVGLNRNAPLADILSGIQKRLGNDTKEVQGLLATTEMNPDVTYDNDYYNETAVSQIVTRLSNQFDAENKAVKKAEKDGQARKERINKELNAEQGKAPAGFANSITDNKLESLRKKIWGVDSNEKEVDDRSLAAQLAEKQGLRHIGYGLYVDKSGHVVAKSVDGNLIFLNQDEVDKASKTVGVSKRDAPPVVKEVGDNQNVGAKPRTRSPGKAKNVSDFMSQAKDAASPERGKVDASKVLSGTKDKPLKSTDGGSKKAVSDAASDKAAGRSANKAQSSEVDSRGQAAGAGRELRGAKSAFAERPSIDPALAQALERLEKKVSKTKKEMKDIMDKLKGEKNPVLKEQLMRKLGNLDRELGTAYIQLTKLQDNKDLSSKLTSIDFDNMKNLFRDAEQVSSDLAKEAGNKTSAIASGVSSKNTPLMSAWSKNEAGQAARDEIEDEVDKKTADEDNASKGEKVKPSKADNSRRQDRLARFGAQQSVEDLANEATPEEAAANAEKQSKRVANASTNRKVNSYSSAIEEMASIADDTSLPSDQRNNARLAQTLLNRAQKERVMGRDTNSPDPTTINYTDGVSHLETTPGVDRLLKSINAGQGKTRNLDDVIDEMDTYELRRGDVLSDGERYYLGSLISNVMSKPDSTEAKDLVKGLNDKRGLVSGATGARNVVRKMISKARWMNQTKPLEDGKTETTGSDQYVMTGTEPIFGDNGIDNLTRPKDKTPRNAEAEAQRGGQKDAPDFGAGRRPKTGQELEDALYSLYVKGENKKKLPSDDKIVRTLTALGRGEKPTDTAYGKSLMDVDTDRLLTREPTMDELERWMKQGNRRSRGITSLDREMPSGSDRPSDTYLDVAAKLKDYADKERERKEARKKKRGDDTTPEPESGKIDGLGEMYSQFVLDLLIEKWARKTSDENNSHLPLQSRLIEDAIYLSDSIKTEPSYLFGDEEILKMSVTLEEELQYLASTKGTDAVVEMQQRIDGMNSEEVLAYRLAESQFTEANNYYWQTEKVRYGLMASIEPTLELKEFRNPATKRLEKTSKVLESQQFLEALVEVSTEFANEKIEITSKPEVIQTEQWDPPQLITKPTGRRRIDLTSKRRNVQ